MNCPRCSTPMRAAQIGASHLKSCPGCEGAWYPGEALASITDHSLAELKDSALEPSLVADRLETVDLDKPIDCPECLRPMMRYRYTMSCDVVLDECFDHGVWLDDGELGSLMAFLEELYCNVEGDSGRLASGIVEKNLEYLEELSRSSPGELLSLGVIDALYQVHSRLRESATPSQP